MKVTVELKYDIDFAVCYDEEPGKIYNNHWVETLEEALILKEKASIEYPNRSWYIRICTSRI